MGIDWMCQTHEQIEVYRLIARIDTSIHRNMHTYKNNKKDE